MDENYLRDREEILEVTRRYARGADRQDLELMRSCYHPGAIDHHVGYDGPIEGFIDYLAKILGPETGTHHMLGHQIVEIDGDVARVESYCINTHWDRGDQNPERNYTAISRMIDRFERRNGEWRIAERWATRDATLPHSGNHPTPNLGPQGAVGQADPLFNVTGWPVER